MSRTSSKRPVSARERKSRRSVYRIRCEARPDDLPSEIARTVSLLDRRCFPVDKPEPLEGSFWWLARDARGKPVAFAGMKVMRDSGGEYGYFSRGGTIAAHRGRGLYQRMIDAAFRMAKRRGLRCVITYVLNTNPASANALVRRGMKHYWPQDPWAGERDAVYFILELDHGRKAAG